MNTLQELSKAAKGQPFKARKVLQTKRVDDENIDFLIPVGTEVQVMESVGERTTFGAVYLRDGQEQKVLITDERIWAPVK